MNKKRMWVAIGAVIVLVLAFSIVACKNQSFTTQGVTNYNELHLSANSATGTPALMVDQAGAGVLFEVRDASTPVYEIYDGGAVSQTGDQTITGDLSVAGNAAVAAPTAATTATPALRVNSAAAGANILEIQDSGSSVFVVENGGDTTIAGNVAVAQPTAAATATPMIYANTAADAPNLMVIAKDATPVVIVHNAGMLDVGTGSGGTADGVGDLLVAGDAEVDDTLDVDGDIDLNGDGFDVDITAGWSIDGDAASNLTTNTGDLTIENEDKSVIVKGDEAAADAIYLDANDAAGTGVTIAVGASGGLNIGGGLTDIGVGAGGTADGDDDLLVAGDCEVDDTLDVDGDIDLDGDGFDVNITGGASIDADLASNFSAAAGDITIDAEAGSLVLIGSEAAADSISLDANDTVTSGLTIVVGSVSGMSVDGGLTDFGGGTYTVADGDNDVGVQGDLEVNGDVVLGSANYPLENAASGREIYFGLTGAFTGTTTVLSTTTGIENIVAAFCSVDDPDDDAGDAFICIGAGDDGDVTLTALDTAGDTSTEVDTTVYYIIVGY